jgi:hypothetical protein
MSKADIMAAYALSKVGLPYQLGEEFDHNAGPTLTPREDGDCSAVAYASYTEAHVLINGKPLSRETADTYYRRAKRIAQPTQVGDMAFFLKGDRCPHMAMYAGNGLVVEAGNHGPNNTYPGKGYVGTCTVAQMNARGAVWGRFAGNDIGELEEDMTKSEVIAILEEWWAGKQVDVHPGDLKEAVALLDAQGVIAKTHAGGKVPTINTLRYVVYKALKRAGVT